MPSWRRRIVFSRRRHKGFHFDDESVFFRSRRTLFPSLLLEVGPLNAAGGLGSLQRANSLQLQLSSHSGVWGRGPAEIKFSAF